MRELFSTTLAEHPQFLAACDLTETSFVQATCDIVKTAFDANTVFIASLGLVEADYLSVTAYSTGASELQTRQFFASATPCGEAIIQGQPVSICKDVCSLFPDAKILTHLNAQAYISLPLKDTAGCVIGALVAEWSDPVSQSSLDMVIDAITPFLGRVVAELQRASNAHVIPTLINPISPMSQEDLTETFRIIAEQAQKLTNVNTVAIVHRTGKGSPQFRILAAVSQTANVDDAQGLLVDYFGIPCQNMISHDVYFEGSGVLERYVDVPIMQAWDVESYLGYSFRNSAGETIGHIAFLHNRPMRASVQDSDIIRVIATRAGQELQRYELERQREMVEKALRVRSKLESLGTMSGTIAHDFNNQLTAMIGNTELAALELPQGHPALTYLDEAETVMWRARDVVKEIMDFAGQSTVAALEKVALGEVVESVMREFSLRLNDGTEVIAEIEPDIPMILSRRMQVFQIITNLMANGLDALIEGETKTLTLSLRMIDLPDSARDTCLTEKCSTLPKRCVCVQLQDSGKGMDKATAERIFDPYFSTKGASRGLGLSSVLGIAKRLGIGLTCESEVGVGTTFRLLFAPLNGDDAKVERAEEPTPFTSTSTPKTVLVVDDNESVNAIVEKLFLHWGWNVITAFSGEDAVKRAKSSTQIDLAVLDVVMPGISGIETAIELRNSRSALPVLLISGYNELNAFDAVAEDEKTKFLVKPFNSRQLKSVFDALYFANESPR